MESRLPGVVGPVEWSPDSARFWFRLGTSGGWRFQAGERSSASSRDAFDHDRLAAALASATERDISPERLELTNLSPWAPTGIEFDFADERWCWDGQESRRLTDDERYGVRSPDGGRLAFTRDHDLWVRDLATGAERRLTEGGRAESFYGRVIPSPLRMAGLPGAGQPWRETAVLWSPDGRRLLTHRIDTAGAGTITMTLSAPLPGRPETAPPETARPEAGRPETVRPEAVEYLYPLPGDEVLPTATLLVIDVDSGQISPVDIPPLEMYYYGSPIPAASATSRTMWWREDGESLYLVRRFRGHRRVALHEVGADGTSRVVVDESAETPIDTNLSTSGPVNHRTIDDKDLTVWYSQRDGWGHLYLYQTSTGNPVRQLTSGPWAVADVCHADAEFVYFTAVGRNPDEDPYLRRLYRIRLDEPGARPELLTSQAGGHEISFAPDGSRFVTTWSMIDSPPVTQLCRSAGEVIGTIATADLSGLLAAGWTYPERFAAPARDGHTKVYGVILRPSTFDPALSYPVIDSIYGGPQMNQAPAALIEATTAGHRLWQAQAIAELGFVVVMIDGLGMPFRSREFRDVSYRNLADAGLPDHISALRSLAERYPCLDLDRVGIFGHSAGGYASAQAILAHPDFYKVCVSSAGNHDHRVDKASWIERYQGWPVGEHYVEQANRTIAHRLEGKLLLIHGEADENVPVAATLSLADALVAADKDFDLVILPNRPHACGADPYVIRRRWDYFVRHLAGQRPPRYALRRDQGRPDAYQTFARLAGEEWAWRRAEFPDMSLDEPLKPWLPDVGPEAQGRRTARWTELLGRLDEVDRAQLSPEQAEDFDVYRYQITTLTGQQAFRLFERPANADSAFWMDLTSQSRRRLRSAEDAVAFTEWLRQIPRYIDQNIENMRAGARRGFAPPRITMTGREATIRSVAECGPAEDTGFAKPLGTLPDSVSNRARLAKDGLAVIESEVLPAYRKLLDFFVGEYVPSLPADIAASSGPDGEAFYASQLYQYATTDLTARQIHELGLEQVSAIRAEMAGIAAEAGFRDADAMLAFMRADSKFYASTPTELLRFAAWQAKRFDAVAHHYFGRLPRMRFGIEEPPPDLAPFYTFGRGGPHRYILNTYNLGARPLYSIPALTLHEAAPGHAFQIPFALEQTQHPEYRQKVYISAYGEGWALYTERLGVEMGMYETPFEMMGMLSYQMWRAVRLVIDPGMHALGWSREQAQDYLRQNTAISDHEIVTEVDRYISWPGQATAYYLGMLKILEARGRAEQALGADFDIRNFHDQILSLGSVPLPVIDSAVDTFIARGGTSPFSADT